LKALWSSSRQTGIDTIVDAAFPAARAAAP
jgi:hypothetical protein